MTAPDLWPTKDEVTQIVAHGRGMWKTCCGCHESNEGHPTGPIHPALQCVVGSGCHECGGIGAVWDTTDYADMADFLMREEAPATPADRIAALTEQLAAARRDAEEAEGYAGELEAKLAKAVKSAFEEGFLAGTEDGWVNNPRIEIEWKLSKALAEIKGGKGE